MSVKRSMNIDDISIRATSYGIKGVSIDGNDILDVYDATRKARNHVRKRGPILIVASTYRYMGHSKSDANRYRTKEEIKHWKNMDPIKRMRNDLIKNKMAFEKELSTIEKKAAEAIEEAVEYANDSPYPSIDTIMDDVYA